MERGRNKDGIRIAERSIKYDIAVEIADSGKHWAEPFALTVDEVLENMRTGKGGGYRLTIAVASLS